MKNVNHSDHHSHEGHHHHADVTHVTRALVWGIALNMLFVVVEFAFGVWQESMGLISDAGHNLSDVVSLVLVLVAVKLSQAAYTDKYTYGYKKSTILVSLLNAAILLVAVGVIVWESIERLVDPRPIDGGVVTWVAGLGIVINAFTAWLFMKDRKGDLNIRGAYLHMVADTLVSVGVLVSGIIISYTGWYAIDPIIGITVAVVIFFSTWSLLRASVRLSLDGVPEDVDLGEVEREILSTEGVEAMHHLHVWAISTTENAMTVHVVVGADADECEVKRRLKAVLKSSGIGHATVETERRGECCDEDRCG